MSHDTGSTSAPPIPFDNSFAREMEGFFVDTPPAKVNQPRMLVFNHELAAELGLDPVRLDSELGARLFSGAEVPEGARPIAQVYAGHQFGHFSPRLGDGRALLLGEVVDREGQRRDLQWKGSGPTVFSRGGDGLAAIGPVLREYLVGEAMHALGVPTTRALAAVTTGQPVFRETPLHGAVLTRVASSHVRIGTFQYFAARKELDQVRQLADYVIARHDPELADREDRYLGLLEAVCARQASLVARWMQLGFVHGVMNTDNTTISGETIDYGPCAFMERYSPETVFSSIDRGGRYAYGRQPQMVFWNLSRFAETLLPLIDADEERAVAGATQVVQGFVPKYERAWLGGMRTKLGLLEPREGDEQLVGAFLECLEGGEVDFTLAFRALMRAADGEEGDLRALFADTHALDAWLARWRARLDAETTSQPSRVEAMRLASPAFIPRNELVEAALGAAGERGELAPFRELLEVVLRPYEDQPGREAYARPASPGAPPYRTFCGT